VEQLHSIVGRLLKGASTAHRRGDLPVRSREAGATPTRERTTVLLGRDVLASTGRSPVAGRPSKRREDCHRLRTASKARDQPSTQGSAKLPVAAPQFHGRDCDWRSLSQRANHRPPCIRQLPRFWIGRWPIWCFGHEVEGQSPQQKQYSILRFDCSVCGCRYTVIESAPRRSALHAEAQG
jgi:hypothetical protein